MTLKHFPLIMKKPQKLVSYMAATNFSSSRPKNSNIALKLIILIVFVIPCRLCWKNTDQ